MPPGPWPRASHRPLPGDAPLSPPRCQALPPERRGHGPPCPLNARIRSHKDARTRLSAAKSVTSIQMPLQAGPCPFSWDPPRPRSVRVTDWLDLSQGDVQIRIPPSTKGLQPNPPVLFSLFSENLVSPRGSIGTTLLFCGLQPKPSCPIGFSESGSPPSGDPSSKDLHPSADLSPGLMFCKVCPIRTLKAHTSQSWGCSGGTLQAGDTLTRIAALQRPDRTPLSTKEPTTTAFRHESDSRVKGGVLAVGAPAAQPTPEQILSSASAQSDSNHAL